MTILIKLRLHAGYMGGILKYFHNGNFRKFLHQAGGIFDFQNGNFRWPWSTTPLSFEAPSRGTSWNIHMHLIFPETRVIGLHVCRG